MVLEVTVDGEVVVSAPQSDMSGAGCLSNPAVIVGLVSGEYAVRILVNGTVSSEGSFSVR